MSLFLRRKGKLEIDLSEMEDEKESIAGFLRSQLKAEVTLRGQKAFIDSESLSSEELRRSVNKYVYHRNLNNRYYTTLEKNIIKLKRFGNVKQHEKPKRKATPPSTIKHGW